MSFLLGIGAGAGIGGPLNAALTPAEEAIKQQMWQLTPVRLLDPFTLTQLYFRGKIKLEDFYLQMLMQGFSKSTAAKYLDSQKIIPNRTDQVTFVVKEGYTPETLKGLLDLSKEPAPKEFIAMMQKLGYSNEDAIRYWITHYDVLGRSEFEEMYQRLNAEQLKWKTEDMKKLGITAATVQTDLEFLKRMYKIKDIFPGLRERLALLSFKPLSRVDIRRLEDVGIIPAEKLAFYNREIGYSPNDSEDLAQFTILDNAMKDIKPLIMTGAISLQEGEAMLVQEGATQEQAAKLIKRVAPYAKASKSKADRDLAITDYLEAFEIGYYDRTKTKAELMKLGLDEIEAELKIRIREHKMKIKATNKSSTKPKDLTRTDILKEYRLGITTRQQAEKYLTDINLDLAEAKRLLDIEDAKPVKR